MPKEGYDETAVIPECCAAVEEGGVSGVIDEPASICGEPFSPRALSPEATLQPPPDPVTASNLTVDTVSEAWRDGASTALGISAALSRKFGKLPPWAVVRDALDAGFQTRWIEITEKGMSGPFESAEAQNVIFRASTEGG